jgi:hypothetical protein
MRPSVRTVDRVGSIGAAALRERTDVRPARPSENTVGDWSRPFSYLKIVESGPDERPSFVDDGVDLDEVRLGPERNRRLLTRPPVEPGLLGGDDAGTVQHKSAEARISAWVSLKFCIFCVSPLVWPLTFLG